MKAFARGLTLASAIFAGSSAMGEWYEDFEHNNPALYTNMNGQPDNLTITGGRARFSGAGGAYYARQDFMIHFDGITGQGVLGARQHWAGPFTGTAGVGFFSPSLNLGISYHANFETNARTVFEHQGWNSTQVLASGVAEPGYEENLYIHYGPFVNWYFSTGKHGFNVQWLEPEEDMFFFMYGSSLSGPGELDWAINGWVPEPSGIAALGIGAATLLLFRRRSKPAR
ncbi:MAG: PEP-CTERM sorting domain-containing protein [Gemmatimonadota bacterium]|nr:PEP-CTERM sorting domain-containing protein [Gemmatimonadota bacterium]